MSNTHKVNYRIWGDQTQFVEIELEPGKSVIAERGSLMMKEGSIRMEFIQESGDRSGSRWKEKFKKVGKWIIPGNQNIVSYTNTDAVKRQISFAAPNLGKIIPIDLSQFDGELSCHKEAFLCATTGVSIENDYTQKLGKGIFGYKKILSKKLEGDGYVFLHSGGSIYEKELQTDEKIRIDLGNLVAMTKNIVFGIESIDKVKQGVYRRGEKLYLVSLTGPGKIWLGSLPFNRFVNHPFFRSFLPES